MLNRRLVLAAAPLAALSASRAALAQRPPARSPAPQQDFDSFVAGVKAEARRKGMSPAALDRAFENVRMNPRVIELDRHQPEFTMTWQQYRDRIVSEARVARGRALYQQNRRIIDEVAGRYGVGAGIMVGIWGLESNFGQATGGFNVIEALATLAWDTRRPAFFRSELMDALRIIDHGDIAPERMTGSYAGAMGQTQFMPDSFLKYAVDFDGKGRRDIWGDLGDVFASTANYLSREGWRRDLPWGTPVVLPPGFDAAGTGRAIRRPVADWSRMGVRTADGRMPGPPDALGAVILPAGPGGDAFMAFWQNFLAIRRYNPSDFYCICVGLIGDRVVA